MEDRLIYRWIALGVALVLPACTDVSGNGEFVSVRNVWDASQALPKATEWCARYGKVPRMSISDELNSHYSYNCVRPS
jgi:hypothetical protein